MAARLDNCKVSYVRSVSILPQHTGLGALYSAFVSCLSVEEAVELLKLMIRGDSRQRNSVLRRVVADIGTDAKKCHIRLVEDLIDQLGQTRGAVTQVYGFILFSLFSGAPTSQKEKIIQTLITSRYKNLRRRAYKLLNSAWEDHYVDAVCKVWADYRDHHCAQLMIVKLPMDKLMPIYPTLAEAAIGTIGVSRLFLKIANNRPEILAELFRIDQITYVYVLVKLGLTLSRDEAIAIVCQNCGNDRFGLLLWCLGKLGLWDVLQEIYENRDEYSKIHHDTIVARVLANNSTAPSWRTSDPKNS